MNAKEARQITESATDDVTSFDVLYGHAVDRIGDMAKCGDSRVVNPLLYAWRDYSRQEIDTVYTKLREDGFKVEIIGDNAIISW